VQASVDDISGGNTSILAADFDVLTWYVQKFNDGRWLKPEGNLPDPNTLCFPLLAVAYFRLSCRSEIFMLL
jgi:hypothetical protein